MFRDNDGYAPRSTATSRGNGPGRRGCLAHRFRYDHETEAARRLALSNTPRDNGPGRRGCSARPRQHADSPYPVSPAHSTSAYVTLTFGIPGCGLGESVEGT